MPITPTFPGVYIEEIPSSARTITPAPTSVAVFVGYTHPFKTKPQNVNSAVLLFSFSDYEREHGGFYASGTISADVPYAVNDFFLNGGSIAYVVGLKPRNQFTDNTAADIAPPTATVSTTGGGIVFSGKEPVDLTAMTVNVAPDAGNLTATITVTYGTRVETYRGVTIANAGVATHVSQVLANSSLVSVAPLAGNWGASYLAAAANVSLADPPFAPGKILAGTFSAADFTNVFKEESSLDKVDIFNLLMVPGVSDNAVLSAALAFAEKKRAFMIMDPKPQLAADPSGGLPDIGPDFSGPTVPKSPNGAIYFPYLKSQHPLTGAPVEMPPSGFVAGIYARTDTNRGVWKAPAGLETTVLATTGVVDSGRMTDMRQGVLNQLGVNALRSFPGIGTVVFGARTLVAANPAFQPWKYVPVRRTALFIEQTLYRELKWAIFEPNDEPLWIALRTSVGNFMMSLFTQGAFQGTKPSHAFLVKCDSTTTTQDDIDKGIVNIIVGFRPLKPAEFVFVKIMQLAGQVQA
ncbi:MAG TPA: phage tail sheath C-terminal domain-containing protein [Thermoanaerobaculia bacterium]